LYSPLSFFSSFPLKLSWGLRLFIKRVHVYYTRTDKHATELMEIEATENRRSSVMKSSGWNVRVLEKVSFEFVVGRIYCKCNILSRIWNLKFTFPRHGLYMGQLIE
jgi:hypothetical protein